MPTPLKDMHVIASDSSDQPDRELLDRRAALKWLSLIGGSIGALLAALPSTFAFITPAVKAKSAVRWMQLGEASLFDIGVPDRVDFTDNVQDAWVTQRVIRSVWLLTEDGETFTAYNARCPHLGCAFSFDEAKNHFACPCHKGVFELKTGAVISGPPPRPLDKLQTKVENGYVYVAYEDFRLGSPEKIRV